MFPAAAGTPGFLGIVLLDTRFPRPLGDIGHPGSFGVPVRHQVVPGALPRDIVASAAALRASGWQQPLVAALQALEAQGARALTTSCGFLVLLQQQLQAAVGVPVVSSSLLLLPDLLRRSPQVGVLTISAAHLGREHLIAAGVPPQRLGDVLVQGLDPGSHLAAAILDNRPTLDVRQAERDVVQAARALQARAPQLRSVVLECTNLPPYAAAVHAATGWELKSLLDAAPLLQWVDGR